jgi:hypothetical protein
MGGDVCVLGWMDGWMDGWMNPMLMKRFKKLGVYFGKMRWRGRE